ncbi:MAG: HD domain-containing protein [Candidatus Moraniibacteriota bacterium]
MLQKLFGFAKILNELQKVERVIRVPGSERWENDVEHSYSLAMLAWYIVDSQKLSLDRDKVFCYALAHDLVEVYAGDTYLWSKDQALLDSKLERERMAAERLLAEFPEVPEIHAAIVGYVEKNDPESRFVYALDKIEPLVKLYLDGGRTWREKEVTLEMVYENKKNKVALSPEIKNYFDEFMVLLRKEEASLFPKKEA